MTSFKRITAIVIITAAAAFLVRAYMFEPVYIASESMLPTLYKGHRLILDKMIYKFRKPLRGEIISFISPVSENHDFVKRIIAIGGDEIEIKNKQVYLNGKKLLEFYTQYTRPNEILQGDNTGPLKVPENSVFVLGDNRDNSNDSSTWKDSETGEHIYFLKLSDIQGKIRGIY